VSYTFTGELQTIYTTLVVRLWYSRTFGQKELWQNAAEFTTSKGDAAGVVFIKVGEGEGKLSVFFDTGVPDELKGECIVAFVVPKPGAEIPADFEKRLSAHLIHLLGPTFKPQAIRIVPELPKTQSGKIVRRLLRQKYLGEPLGDLSTVENPHALESVCDNAQA